MHQAAVQSATPAATRRQTESTGPIELIAIASVSAASQYSGPGAAGGVVAEAARDAGGGTEGGIASVLLREREVQRRLEASQASLLESQRCQEAMQQRLERAEEERRASLEALDSAKVLPRGPHTDREFSNIQDYFLGLAWR